MDERLRFVARLARFELVFEDSDGALGTLPRAQPRRSLHAGRHRQGLAAIRVIPVVVESIELRGNGAAAAVAGAEFAVDFGFHCFIPWISTHIFHAPRYWQLIYGRERLEGKAMTQALLHQSLEALRERQPCIAAS
jgi:hypothetical protein